MRKPDGEMFALAPVEDFAAEAELLKNNTEFMAFLRELFQEEATTSLKSLREELGLSAQHNNSIEQTEQR